MSTLQIRTRTDGDKTRVELAGVVDEHSDFAPLDELSGPIEVDTRGVRRFNSVGVRFWIDAMRGLSVRARPLVFVACSRPVVEQLSMIRGFLAHGVVKSFHAPMRCERCDHDVDVLYDAREVQREGGFPQTGCPKCGRPMELDDIEDQYLLFLREPTQVG